MRAMTNIEHVRVLAFEFQVKSKFKQRAFDDLLEIIRERGATCCHHVDSNDVYIVEIPAEWDWTPFYNTIRESEVVASISREFRYRTVSYLKSH